MAGGRFEGSAEPELAFVMDLRDWGAERCES